MIALNFSQDPVTKIKFRAASMEMAARVLRDGGMMQAAVFVDQMIPAPVRRTSRDLSWLCVEIRTKDSDVIVRSTRRSGLRYVALLLRASGSHDEAALHLERCADMIPVSDEGSLRQADGHRPRRSRRVPAAAGSPRRSSR